MTKNQFTTLVSIRVDNDVCAEMEKWLQKQDFYTRSSVINLALRRLFMGCSDEMIWEFLHTNKFVQPCDTKN